MNQPGSPFEGPTSERTTGVRLAREGPQGSAAITAALGLHRSIVYRLLKTLELRGFIQRDADGRFELVLLVAVLGQVGHLLEAAGRLSVLPPPRP